MLNDRPELLLAPNIQGAPKPGSPLDAAFSHLFNYGGLRLLHSELHGKIVFSRSGEEKTETYELIDLPGLIRINQQGRESFVLLLKEGISAVKVPLAITFHAWASELSQVVSTAPRDRRYAQKLVGGVGGELKTVYVTPKPLLKTTAVIGVFDAVILQFQKAIRPIGKPAPASSGLAPL